MNTLRRWLVWIVGIGLITAVVLLVVRFLNMRPPNELTIATDRAGGAYYAFAEQYRDEMTKLGYTLNILPTAGSIEALQALERGEADAAFAEAGAPSYAGVDTSEMATLASLFYEPFWAFYRADLSPEPVTLADFAGLRLSIGEDGSGTQIAAEMLLADNGVTRENAMFRSLDLQASAEALQHGEVDAILLLASPSSPVVTTLLQDPALTVLSTERYRAYQSRYKNITVLTLGEGAIDLAENTPDSDKQLLATVATLVAGPTLHPDLARLLLGVATAVHNQGGLLETTGEFPSDKLVLLPLSQDAANFLENGPTGLERYLPFWIASRMERILFVVIPLIVLFYPFFRSTPLAFTFYFRYRIYRWYQFVRKVEQGIDSYSIAEIDRNVEELRDLLKELTDSMRVPLFYLADFYNLRLHINLVINRLNARRAVLTGDAPPPPEDEQGVEMSSTILENLQQGNDST